MRSFVRVFYGCSSVPEQLIDPDRTLCVWLSPNCSKQQVDKADQRLMQAQHATGSPGTADSQAVGVQE